MKKLILSAAVLFAAVEALFLLSACNPSQGNGLIVQSSRNKIEDISSKIHELPTGEMIMSGSSRMGSAGDHVFIVDYKSLDNAMHIFDASSLQYRKSVLPVGPGPEEITSIGEVCYDEGGSRFLVPDHGKEKLFVFDEGQLLQSDEFSPQNEFSLLHEGFPSQFVALNDDEVLGIMVKPTSESTFNQCMARYNLTSGKYQDYAIHPELEKQRLHVAVSKENNLCVLSYRNRDLLVLTDLDGEVISEVQGPDWGDDFEKRRTFGNSVITGDYIIASYSGKSSGADDNPTRLLVFDTKGNYLKTLETGQPILNICYNAKSKRLFMCLNSEPQFVYLDLKDLGL